MNYQSSSLVFYKVGFNYNLKIYFISYKNFSVTVKDTVIG